MFVRFKISSVSLRKVNSSHILKGDLERPVTYFSRLHIDLEPYFYRKLIGHNLQFQGIISSLWFSSNFFLIFWRLFRTMPSMQALVFFGVLIVWKPWIDFENRSSIFNACGRVVFWKAGCLNYVKTIATRLNVANSIMASSVPHNSLSCYQFQLHFKPKFGQTRHLRAWNKEENKI